MSYESFFMPLLKKQRRPEPRAAAAPTANVRVSKAPVPGGYLIQHGRRVERRAPEQHRPKVLPYFSPRKFNTHHLGLGNPRTIKTKI